MNVVVSSAHKRTNQAQLGPQALNTSNWRLAVPALYKAFPDQQMVVNGVCFVARKYDDHRVLHTFM